MNKYTCSRCQKEFDNYQSLRKHVGRIHKISSIDFFVEFNLNGEWPRCKCGCGEKVKWDAQNKKFRDLVHGHYSRIHNNWGHNEKAIKASAETRRRQYANGERKVWNDGLNCDDPRVQKNLVKLKEKVKSAEHRKMKSIEMRINRLNGTVPTLSGPNHPQWQGGVSSVNQLARSDRRLYSEWKLPILKRDKFKCTECGNPKDLHVHHNAETFSDIIKKVMTLDDFDHINEFDRKRDIVNRVVEYHITNKISGATLCSKCHNKLHPGMNFI